MSFNHPVKLIVKYVALISAIFFIWPIQTSAQFSVTDQSPEPYSTTAPPSTSVILEFSQTIDFGTVENGIRFHTPISGSLTGSFSLLAPNRVSFTPFGAFNDGDHVSVTITENLLSSGGVPASPEQWKFYVAPGYGSDSFLDIEEVDLEEGGEPTGIISVDLNNNLLPDLITVNSNNSTITVLENQNHLGLGFVEFARINTGIQPDLIIENEPLTAAQGTTLPTNSSIVSGDLNNNGFSDAVVAATLTNQLIILRNSANGTPDLSVELIDTGERPVKVVTSDMNNNGNLDLVVASAGTDRVYIHFNNGDGTFAAPVFFDTGLAPLTLAVEDINSSGLPDIIIPLSGENSVIALINQGSGSFSQQVLLDNLPYTPSFIITGNIVQGSGTDEPDIVLGSSDETSLYLYRNSGSVFTFSRTLNRNDVGRPLSAIAFDVTASGSLDILTSHFSSDNLLLNLNAAGGTSFTGQTVLDPISSPIGLTTADYDFSGSLDIAATNFSTGQVTILYNDAGPPGGCLTSIGSEHDFGDVCLFEQSSNEVTIQNVCSYPLEVEVEVNGEGFETSVSTFEIAPGEQYLLPVTFSPTERREYEGSIRGRAVRQGGVFQTRFRQFKQLNGRGVITELTVPGSAGFGEIEIGQSITRQIQINNSGDVTNDITLSLDNNDGIFSIQGSTNRTLTAGSQTTVTIEFTPLNAQLYNNELVIFSESDCGNEEYRVVLTGTGIDPPPPLPDLVAADLRLVPDPGVYTFGETYTIEGTLRLDGELTVSNPFDVIILVNNNEVLRSRVTDILNPGNTRLFDLQNIFTREGQNSIRFIVDSEAEIEEPNEANNELNITINVEPGQLGISPNPFTPNSDGFNDQVEFDFTQVGNISNPVVQIFSFNGKLVRTLRNVSGTRMEWDGLDDSGNRLGPGIYLYVAQENNQLIARGSITLAL